MTDRNYIKEQEQVYEKQIKELKEQVKFFTNKSQRLDKENQQLKEDYQVLRATNISLNDLVNSCQQKIRDYKSVLSEVIEYIEEKERKDIKGNTLYCEENLIWHELLLILDKVGGSNE